jgi:hypothetical protein
VNYDGFLSRQGYKLLPLAGASITLLPVWRRSLQADNDDALSFLGQVGAAFLAVRSKKPSVLQDA